MFKKRINPHGLLLMMEKEGSSEEVVITRERGSSFKEKTSQAKRWRASVTSMKPGRMRVGEGTTGLSRERSKIKNLGCCSFDPLKRTIEVSIPLVKRCTGKKRI